MSMLKVDSEWGMHAALFCLKGVALFQLYIYIYIYIYITKLAQLLLIKITRSCKKLSELLYLATPETSLATLFPAAVQDNKGDSRPGRLE